MKIKNMLRDIYVNMVLYTNNLYTYWELLIAFGIGVVLGGYLTYQGYSRKKILGKIQEKRMKDVLKFIWFIVVFVFGLMAIGLATHLLVELFLSGWNIVQFYTQK